MLNWNVVDQLSYGNDEHMRRFGSWLLFFICAYWAYQLLRPYGLGQTPFIALDYVNLLFHEAGHLLFMLAGDFWSIAGGSLMQSLVPLVVTLYLWRQSDMLGVGFGIFWLGNSLISTSYYMADAVEGLLPLLGRESSIHDWQWLMAEMHLTPYAVQIAEVVKWGGGAFLLLGMVVMGYAVLSMKPRQIL